MPSKAKSPKTSTTAASKTAAKSAANKSAANEGFENAAFAFSDLNLMSKDTFDAFVESASTASKSAEEISARVAAYTQQSWETGVETAKKVAAAKTFHEYVELQTEAARDAMNTYVGQLTDLTELCASAFKDSLTPINKRMTAATQAFRV